MVDADVILLKDLEKPGLCRCCRQKIVVGFFKQQRQLCFLLGIV